MCFNLSLPGVLLCMSNCCCNHVPLGYVNVAHALSIEFLCHVLFSIPLKLANT